MWVTATENDRIDPRAPILTILLLADACGAGATVGASPNATHDAEQPAPATAPLPQDAGLSPIPAASPITLDSVAIADDVTLSITSPVVRGETAIAKVRTVRGADCTIVVTYPSGMSTAPGLEPRSADGAGDVVWSWTVEPDAPLGSWTVEVTCGTVSGLRAVGRELLTVR